MNAAEDVEQLKTSYITSGNAKWYSHFGKQFLSNWTQTCYATQLNHFLVLIQQKWKHIHAKTYIQMIIVTLFCNSQKFETSQKSTNWSMNKQNPVYPHNKMLVNNKQNWYMQYHG